MFPGVPTNNEGKKEYDEKTPKTENMNSVTWSKCRPRQIYLRSIFLTRIYTNNFKISLQEHVLQGSPPYTISKTSKSSKPNSVWWVEK